MNLTFTFAEIGLIDYKGMNIGWLNSKNNYARVSLAKVKAIGENEACERNVDEVEEYVPHRILENNNVVTKYYKVFYNVLQVKEEYFLDQYALKMFRGKQYYFLDLFLVQPNSKYKLVHTKAPADSSVGTLIGKYLHDDKPLKIKVTEKSSRNVYVEDMSI